MAVHPINVLIIDDEETVCNFFRRLLDRKGCRTVTAVSESEALRALESSPFQVAMVDLKLPDTDGLTLLKHIKRKQPNCEVIIMTGFSTIKTAVKAQGKRKDEEEWSQFARSQGFLVGNTPTMRRLASLAYRLARKDISILVKGETGTGKEVLARFIHATSHRAEKMFIPINCGALSDNLLESELFGHERGSFTGAGSMRRGIFELANNGTLFLDEVGEASLAIQVKLLRVLETGEFMRLGGEKMVHSDVRVISASNVNLEQAMLGREFREDLFYRLNVVKLEIPPLRAGQEDIPMLAEHFVRQLDPQLHVSPEINQLLCAYDWPGNIRELANTMRQAVALCDGPKILPKHFAGKLAVNRPRPVAVPQGIGRLQPSTNNEPPPLDRFWEHYGKPEVLEQLSGGELTQLLHSLRGLEESLCSVMRKKGIASVASECLKTRKRPPSSGPWSSTAGTLPKPPGLSASPATPCTARSKSTICIISQHKRNRI